MGIASERRIDYESQAEVGIYGIGCRDFALGIIIGQWGTPDIEAQSNGVFDEIQCKNLIIVDDAGKRAIELGQNGNDVLIYDRAGQIRIALGRMGSEEVFTRYGKKVSDGYGMTVYSAKGGRGVDELRLYTDNDSSNILLLKSMGDGISAEALLYTTEGEGGLKLMENGVYKWITSRRD